MVSIVGSKPAGDGRWSQSDLLGNAAEWCSDNSMDIFLPTCDRDCLKYEVETSPRVFGGNFYDEAATFDNFEWLRGVAVDRREDAIGFRCARSP
jgi:formylglycine-generating enzyme required for sulfatase activity